MQIGIITVDGRQVGVITKTGGADVDDFVPNLDGYEPRGRATETPLGITESTPRHDAGQRRRHGGSPEAPMVNRHHFPGHHPSNGYSPRGESYEGSGGRPVRPGSAEVDQAVVDAARAHHLDVNTMRSIASIESSMNPTSNANRATQYKGLYQIGRSEWARFGNGGNIYSARDNAMAAARMFDANRAQFRRRYGRDPTDTELYMMHQQGLGFYTRGAMTNIGGNPYPGMHGAQTHESFEAGWGRELARRKAAFKAHEAKPEAEAPKPSTAPDDVPYG
ncbi:hypothetical protein [Bradyrhizobium sp. SZCCHNRI1002]|uniref:hypothetical protein n=1 Tax=Bradyrhizobium sp. SZCCHNRI1002 TaxID=3057274 RepID=UPI0028E88943|nr:hypothetical protein [Bradyrhizobium sp. SZCCHNRI1002]